MTVPPSRNPTGPETGPSASPPPGVKTLLPFDPLRVGLHVARGWKGMLLAGLLGGAGAFAHGWKSFHTHFTAQVQLVRREMQNTFQASQLGESFRPRQFNAATVSSMIRSGPLMERTGGALNPPLSAATLQRRIQIRPEKNTDLITIVYDSDDSAEAAAAAVNTYAENVVALTRDLQAEEARELLAFLTTQLDRTEAELAGAQKEMTAFSRESGLYNADKESEGHLRQLGELELKIETTRIERETLEYRIGQLERELARQDPAAQKLKEARDRLAELLTQYTDRHPEVVEQRARVDSLEQAAKTPGAADPGAFQPAGNTVANSLYLDLISLRGQKESLARQAESLAQFRDQVRARLDTLPDKSLAQARIRTRLDSLSETRDLLAGRCREASLHADQALGYYRLFAPAKPEEVRVAGRSRKIVLVAVGSGILAVLLVALARALRAARDTRLASPSDLRRVTGAPVLATLPAEDTLDADRLARWRFATWAALVRLVPARPDGARLAGVLSALDGEGKTTWIRHLGRAALERGLKVLVVGHGPAPGAATVRLSEALADPARLLARLSASTPPAAEVNAGPDWAWTPAARLRWREALAVWEAEPGLVVLVELPPASTLDGLLLAETLPSVLWLAESGRTREPEVRDILATLRQGGVPLAGALLNRIPPALARLPDLARFGLCLTLCAGLASPRARAQGDTEPGPAPEAHGDLPPVYTPPPSPEDFPLPPLREAPLARPAALTAATPPPPAPVNSASSTQPPHPPLAAWQERLTLGPGDLLNLEVYGHRETVRNAVPIGPDGTLNYLQVQGFAAAGLTVDELREGLTTALHAFMPNDRVIVTPAAYRSKKYFLLGTVIDRGAYTLDRPMTLLEAIARARGLATGLLDQNTVEIADLRRAFVVRGGRKLEVDFVRLFHQGDTSQNIALEPGDYIYLPSQGTNEAHVLGAVGAPGPTAITGNLTALAAVTRQGGFLASAWRRRVLLVRQRPGAARPETRVVDAEAVLRGRARDVPLEPGDLVFVADRPWRGAEEVLDIAIRTFLQTGIATWTGNNIGTAIESPLLPTLRSQ